MGIGYAIAFKSNDQICIKRNTGLNLVFSSQLRAYSYILDNFSKVEMDDTYVVEVNISKVT